MTATDNAYRAVRQLAALAVIPYAVAKFAGCQRNMSEKRYHEGNGQFGY